MTDIIWDLDESKGRLLENPRLLVVGDPMLDLISTRVVFLREPEREHRVRDRELCFESPEPPVSCPGGALSIAMAWRAFGEVTVCGVVGDDDVAQALELQLARNGICSALVAEQGRRTIVKMRFYLEPAPWVPWWVLRFDVESPKYRQRACEETEGALLDQIRQHIHDSAAVAIIDFDKGSVTRRVVREVADLCQALAKPLLIAPKHDWDKYVRAAATVVSVNHEEAIRAFVAKHGDQESFRVKELIEGVRASFPRCAHSVVKLGPEGVAYASGGKAMRVTATPVNVVHTVRAGDVFDAYMLAALLRGYDILQAVRLANLAGGIACTKEASEWPDMHDVRSGIVGEGRISKANRQNLSLVCQGVTSDKEIADARQVSEKTVKSQMATLKGIVGVHRRGQLLQRAERTGFVTPAMKSFVEELDDDLRV